MFSTAHSLKIDLARLQEINRANLKNIVLQQNTTIEELVDIFENKI